MNRISDLKQNEDLGGTMNPHPEQQDPIYFDEFSLSKFLEDYLDYQIEYAYGELSKIHD